MIPEPWLTSNPPLYNVTTPGPGNGYKVVVDNGHMAWPDTAVVMFQMHMATDYSPSIAVAYRNNTLWVMDCMGPNVTDVTNCSGSRDLYPLYTDGTTVSSLVGVPITLQMTFISSTGSNGYVKFERDGVTIYERSGRTTNTAGGDYFKDATLYDYDRLWVDPSSTAGNSISLLTEYSCVWQVP